MFPIGSDGQLQEDLPDQAFIVNVSEEFQEAYGDLMKIG